MEGKDIKALAQLIADGKAELYETAIEHRIDPIYLEYELALLSGSPDASKLKCRIEEKEAGDRALQDELARLSASIGRK